MVRCGPLPARCRAAEDSDRQLPVHGRLLNTNKEDQMKQMTSTGTALCVAAVTLALGSAAHAGAARTFVSGAIGNDSNVGSNCARTTPCRTLAQALTVTTSGGEIDAVDPAGYGPISITVPLTLVGVPGASITVPSGGVGINISAPGSTVIVEDFEITGNGAANTTGISVNTGNLVLENSNVKLLTTGVVGATHEDISNTNFIGNTTAMQSTATGVNVANGVITTLGATNIFRINGGNLTGNATVFNETNPGQNTESAPNCFSPPCPVITNATFFVFGAATPGFSTNITGYTNLITYSGTGVGGGATPPGVETYYGASGAQ
jgi:hypothetical protein